MFISDLSTEAPDEEGFCGLGYLELTSGTIIKRYCGDKTEFGEYIFLSCNNNLVINYTSSAIVSTTKRGFNLYYEGNKTRGFKNFNYILWNLVIDNQGVVCPIINDTFTKTTRPTREMQVITESNKKTKY